MFRTLVIYWQKSFPLQATCDFRLQNFGWHNKYDFFFIVKKNKVEKTNYNYKKVMSLFCLLNTWFLLFHYSSISYLVCTYNTVLERFDIYSLSHINLYSQVVWCKTKGWFDLVMIWFYFEGDWYLRFHCILWGKY